MPTKVISSKEFGSGNLSTIASKSSSIPSPVFAETSIEFLVSIPMTSSICFFTFSESDAGRSILFKTGIISWSYSIA